MKPHPHPVPRYALRLGHFRRRALYGLVALLLATGAWWLYLHQPLAEDAMPNPLEPWLMKLHGAAAMLLLYLTGTMLHGHMISAWHRRRNRLSGSIAAVLFVLLAASGYGLYYFGGESLRRATEWLHWVVGFGVVPWLCWHVVRGRRSARRLS